jgi:crossover junction endodeoxyribonuclease RuvC
MTLIVAIDPGLTGAIGFLRGGVFAGVEDMPVVVKGVGSVKNEVSPAGMKTLIKQYLQPGDAVVTVLEKVGAMPGQGVSSVFSIGDSYGAARAVLATGGFELIQVAPAVWKKHFKLTADKELSRALAQRLFPDAPLHLKKHDGRAEALLLARWLWDTRYA